MKVIGIRSYSFNDEQTGQPISGVRIWCSHPLTDGEGFEAKSFSLSSRQQTNFNYVPRIGDEIIPTLENNKCRGIYLVPGSRNPNK